jgi:hypothetical protein
MKRRLIELGGECLGGEFFLATEGDTLHTWQAGKRAAKGALGIETNKKEKTI